MRSSRTLPLLHSVRAKLLIVLAVLSLPLLVVSLIQLNNYRTDLNGQAAVTARIETTAAGGALLSWLEDHQAYVAQSSLIQPAEAQALYARLRRDTASDADTIITVFDAQGQVVKNPISLDPQPTSLSSSAQARRAEWSDRVARMTDGAAGPKEGD